MKNTIAILTALCLLVCAAVEGQATSYTFNSRDNSGTGNDFADFDHNYLYMWGINASIPANERIVSATIHFEKIVDWTKETDILKVYLLDNPTLNPGANKDIIAISDSQSTTNEMMKYEFNPALPQSINPKYRFESGEQIWFWSDPDVNRNVADPVTGAVRTYYSNLPNNRERYTFDYTFSAPELDLLGEYLLSANTWTHKLGSTAVRYNFGIGFDPDCHYYNEGISLIITTAPVPEPGTLVLLGAGFLGLAAYGRKRIKK